MSINPIKKILSVLLLLFLTHGTGLFSQVHDNTEVYLITCGPGTEIYSIYGHSALRIVNPGKNTDLVYNWGVFDFSTTNFAWKFAKGRLDYILFVEPFRSFLEVYIYEQRSVYLQKINLESSEIDRLVTLINENLKPENIKYRYDFFYDDCSTRIRDILEKSVRNNLLYPPDETKGLPTFRDKIGEYQKVYPWLKTGIDLLLGLPCDKKALFRDRMFLPFDLQKGLSEALINRNGKMTQLLTNPETVLDFPPPVFKNRFYTSPIFVFTTIMIILIILSAIYNRKRIINIIDIVLFSFFSILAVLMVFSCFFTDHLQMKWNLNIVWLNPFILICLGCLVYKKTGQLWFRIVFYLSTIILLFSFVFPHIMNNAFVPVIVILILRSSARANFPWNPFSSLTQ
jgi:hypothetical protein